MAFYFAVPLVVAAALFQAAVPQVGPVGGVKPDLVLVLAVMAGMLMGRVQALTLAFLGGLILDVTTGMPFGFATLALLLVTSVARFPNPNLLEVNPLVCMLVVALATLAYNGIYSLGVLAVGGELDGLRLGTNVILPLIVMNTLLSPLVFGLFSLLGRRSRPVREDWG